MPQLIMKFGGTSVADINRIKNVAARIKAETENGHDVTAVVSAMAGRTNELNASVEAISPFFDAREYDTVVATGEIVSAGLLTLALQEANVPARSWQGWQIPILTSAVHGAAQILNISTDAINSKFNEGMRVAVVAGFQGVTSDKRVSTLGRGGSDTSAVALAAAFGAKRCDIFTDVDGVFTADPRLVAKARKLDRVTYEEMLELSSLGAKVLQTRSVELAMRHKVRLRVRSSFNETNGTLVCDEEEIMENKAVSGVAHSRDEAKVTLLSVADRPGIAAAIFGTLSEASVTVDMIVQNISASGRTDLTFSCPVNQIKRAEKKLRELEKGQDVNFDSLVFDTEVCKLSVVGIGMRSQSGVAAKMFQALADYGINIKVIATSEIKISVLVERKFMELGVQALHDAFDLHHG